MEDFSGLGGSHLKEYLLEYLVIQYASAGIDSSLH